jgi:3',5'-nucleoside bisphosphate phosphatase
MSRARRRRARDRRRAEASQDNRKVDLHMHSLLSDGRDSPESMLEACFRTGLEIVSLTDHDIAPSVASGLHRSGDRQLWHIHGVELSARHEGEELHILAYFPGDMPIEFRSYCRQRTAARASRYRQLLSELPVSGLTAPESDGAEQSLTRLHLAEALVRGGHASSVGEAFTRWLRGMKSPSHFPTVSEVLSAARACGAFCSWAHPPADQVEKWTPGFASLGLGALEAYRPTRGRKSKPRILEIARRNGICVTGGSDSHRSETIGSYSFPAERIREWGLSGGFAPFLTI